LPWGLSYPVFIKTFLVGQFLEKHYENAKNIQIRLKIIGKQTLSRYKGCYTHFLNRKG